LAPEILERDAAFDGFAADLWSAGVLLFVFLVGLAPFKEPNATADRRFREISQGKLKELMASNLPEKTVSDEACDLLQNMLWRDPSKRLTLSQVIQHPWVIGPPPHQALTKQSLPTSLPPGKTIHDFLSRSDHGSNANTPSATTLRFSRKASI
jgi:serine/threonine protein kinase